MTDGHGPQHKRFEIPQRPYREFTPGGRATMRDSIRFELHPSGKSVCLNTLIDRVLEDEHYTAIPWNGFPAPVYLVHDEQTASAFRVIVFEENIAIDVLPKTSEAGLARFYRSVTSATHGEWDITRS